MTVSLTPTALPQLGQGEVALTHSLSPMPNPQRHFAFPLPSFSPQRWTFLHSLRAK
jgi:hypothetical protein